MRKFDVELAICISYGSDSGPWHTESVRVEVDIAEDAELPTVYQMLEAAENVYYDGDSHQDDDVVAIAFYAWSEIVVCKYCNQEYDLTYDGSCVNPDCPLLDDEDFNDNK